MGSVIKPKHEKQVIAETETAGIYMFDCPGCGHSHSFNDAPENEKQNCKTWEFNRDLLNPTVTPSLLYHGENATRCHSFIANGNIQYLGDSSHSLAGVTQKLQPFDYGCSEQYWK